MLAIFLSKEKKNKGETMTEPTSKNILDRVHVWRSYLKDCGWSILDEEYYQALLVLVENMEKWPEVSEHEIEGFHDVFMDFDPDYEFDPEKSEISEKQEEYFRSWLRGIGVRLAR